MTRQNTEAKVGAVVAFGLVGLAMLALKAGHLASFGGPPHYAVRARFANIGGLKVHAPVRSAGVPVGQVTAISLDAGTHQGLVDMEIGAGIIFPVDSSAQILTAGLLGDQYIGIEPGARETTLKAGDVIAQTRSALVFETLLDQFLGSRAATPPSLPPSPRPASAGAP